MTKAEVERYRELDGKKLLFKEEVDELVWLTCKQQGEWKEWYKRSVLWQKIATASCIAVAVVTIITMVVYLW